MQGLLLDPVCNVPVSGESRETKDWPTATSWKLRRVTHLVVQGGRSCLHTDTAIWLTSRLLERHQILGDPCGTTEGLLAEPIDIALSHGCVCVLLPVSCCVISSFPQYPDL